MIFHYSKELQCSNADLYDQKKSVADPGFPVWGGGQPS